MPNGLNNREGPQANCPNGQRCREKLALEVFGSPATRNLKKDSDRAVTPVMEPVCAPAHVAPRVLASQAAVPTSWSTLTGVKPSQA